MGLSDESKARALRAITQGPLTIGLARERRGDGLVEERDPSYARQPISFGSPRDDGVRWVTENAERVEFRYAADADGVVRYWFVTDADGGIVADGDLVPVREAINPLAGTSVVLMPGDVTITLEV